MATVNVEQWLESWVECHLLEEDVNAEAYREAKDKRDTPGLLRNGTPSFDAYLAIRQLAGQLIADSLSDGISTPDLCQAMGCEDIEAFLVDRQIARSG